MKINYLFSGINKEKGFNELQSKYLKENIKNNSNIVFIASIFDNFERSDEQYSRILGWFGDIGINFDESYIIDNRTEKEKAKRIVEKSDVVYLMGGSPELQMKSINEYDLKEFIKKVDIVIGVSAGSMNQSKRVVYKDEYENNQIFDYEGLGLVNFNMYPHLDFENEDLIKENIDISYLIPLISIPNDSFIIVKNGIREYIGDYYIIENGTINIKNVAYKKINYLGNIKLEIEKIKDFIKNIDSPSTSENSLGNYKNAVLVCIDAVLSINRKYYKFVVPRITYFQENYSDITTLQQLLDLIEEEGITGFSKCWNYKHDERVKILYNLVIRLIEISKGYNEKTEIENLKLWAKEITPIDYKNFNVKGIGLATFQYIRMLLGASTVKPDVHIKRAISNVLNRKVSDIEAISLFEQACKELNLDVAIIDHNLWLLLTSDSNNFNMIWKEDKWIKN